MWVLIFVAAIVWQRDVSHVAQNQTVRNFYEKTIVASVDAAAFFGALASLKAPLS